MFAIFPKMISCASKQDVETLAVLTRQHYAGRNPFQPRFNVKEMLAGMGVGYARSAIEGAGACVAEDRQGRLSMSLFVAASVRAGISEQFLLGHMLGYYLLFVLPKIAESSWQKKGFKVVEVPYDRYITRSYPQTARRKIDQERHADLFAACLLVPRPMLVRAHAKLKTVDKLSAFFAVTPELLSYRMEETGLVTPQPQNFMHAESLLQGRDGPSEAMAPTAARPRQAKGMDRLREIARRLDKKA